MAEKTNAVEATMNEFAVAVRKLKDDLYALLQGQASKFSEVVLDLGIVADGIKEFILGLSQPPMVGSAALASCKADVSACWDEVCQMAAAEHPRFMEAGAGGSMTEGARIDNLLKILEKLAPLVKLFLL